MMEECNALFSITLSRPGRGIKALCDTLPGLVRYEWNTLARLNIQQFLLLTPLRGKVGMGGKQPAII